MSVATVHLRADRSLVGDLRLVCREHGCWVEDRFGGFGPWWGQLGDAEALMAHTMTTHFRRPTVNERTPFDLHAAARAAFLPPAVVQDECRGSLRPLVDPDGRLWGMMLTEFGVTRIDGVWCMAYRCDPVRATGRPVNSTFAAILDRWELAVIPADGDPTPSAPLRPLSQLLTLAGA